MTRLAHQLYQMHSCVKCSHNTPFLLFLVVFFFILRMIMNVTNNFKQNLFNRNASFFFLIQNQETALETGFPSARKNYVVVFTFSDQHWIFLHTHRHTLSLQLPISSGVRRNRERKQSTHFYSTGGFPVYFPFLNLPGVAPVFCFFFADPFVSGSCIDRNRTNASTF